MNRIIALGIVAVMACVLASTASAQIMLGTMGNDVIQGTSSDDLIRARGGNDTIAGGGGTDVIFGGNGNDRIKVYSAGEANDRDTVRCGKGSDYVVAGPNDRVLRNCEHVVRLGGGGGSTGRPMTLAEFTYYYSESK